MIVTVHKAYSGHDDDVSTTTIQVGPIMVPNVPSGNGPFDDWYREAVAGYEAEAEAIVVALRRSLPGGTFDAILRKMLAARASVLRVPCDGNPPAVPAEAV